MSAPFQLLPVVGPPAGDPPGQQNGNGGEQPLSAQDIARLKKERRNDRRLVTVHCNQAGQLVLDRGSRNLINSHMNKAWEANNRASQATTLIADEIEDDVVAELELSNQAVYDDKLANVGEMVTQYLAERAGEAPSEAPEIPDNIQDDDQRSQRSAHGSHRGGAGNGAVEADKDKEVAKQDPPLLNQGRPLNLQPPVSTPVTSFLKYPPVLRGTSRPPAPDEWIERYVLGFDAAPHYDGRGERSQVKVELECYDGNSLRWFRWIGLFKALVHDVRVTASEKLAILARSLRGDCRDLVDGLGGGEEAYKEALFRLKESCGRREVIRAIHLRALDQLEQPTDALGFKRFAEKVRTHLFDLCQIGEDFNPDVIERVCAKISINDRLAWNERKVLVGNGGHLNQFGTWLCSRAASYLNAYDIAEQQMRTESAPSSSFKPQWGRPKGNNVGQSNVPRQARTHQTFVPPSSSKNEAQSKPKPVCAKCASNHLLEQCPQFKEASVSERFMFVTEKRLCFACFKLGHRAIACGHRCGINECRRRHHRLLHEDKTVNIPEREAQSNTIRAEDALIAFGATKAFVISSTGERVAISVLVDECSNSTLIRSDTQRALGLEGQSEPLTLYGAGGAESNHPGSKYVELKLVTLEGKEFSIRAASVMEPCRPVPLVNWPKLQNRWSHMNGLPLEKAGGTIDLLIGMDHNYLIVTHESREGRMDEPSASRTRLGWIARGPCGDEMFEKVARVNVIQGEHDQRLNVTFEQFISTEGYGAENNLSVKPSPEEQRAIDIVDSGTRKLDVGYEVPIPWKDGEPKFSNNQRVAERRLAALLVRFQRDPEYENAYRAAIGKYVSEGYARRVTEEEELNAVDQYFLSHHGVFKKSAGEKKIRVVFNSAERFQGKSLNDAQLAGPALQTQLPAVLLHFREGEVGFAADVEAMFSRIRLRPEDARLHRFLFQEKGEVKPAVYQMDRLTFGDRCSPFVAIQTLRRAAEEHGSGQADVIEAVTKHFFVDDFLSSQPDEGAAISLGQRVRKVLAEGDFHLRNWHSNNLRVQEELNGVRSSGEAANLPEQLPSPEAEVHLDALDGTKVLGVSWRPRSDCLSFCTSQPVPEVVTRRWLLSTVAAIFDPLGLAAPIIVQAKIKMKDAAVEGFDWDDVLPQDHQSWWALWFQRLDALNQVKVPRCLFPNEQALVGSELHTFVDASEEAFAAAVYLRNVYADGSVVLRLVIAKSKLASRKSLSVPKLELQAAVLGVRLAKTVGDNLNRKVERRFFWTDSSCTRNWIRSPSPYYKPFVSHRIGEIQALTDQSEWRFVPGELNPSDAATRSSLGPSGLIPASWFDGPGFLLDNEEKWPRDVPWLLPPEEIRPSHSFRTGVQQPSETSSAQVMQLCRRPDVDEAFWRDVEFDPANLVSYTEVAGRLLELVRKCQAEAFPAELEVLRCPGEEVSKRSPLIPFSPVLDPAGVIRVGGRVGLAALPYDRRHPVLLPSRHPFSSKIVAAFHRRLNHVGTDFVLSHVRQHFWIVRGRELVKKIRRQCPDCVRELSKPAVQRMGDLPEARLAVHSPPFTFTAVDYFGPLETEYGRGRTVKRYGALFTCLTTRAVYLDLAKTLSTVDFLLVYRRFTALYGDPQVLHSDNGTNFVGAERELVPSVRDLGGDTELHSRLQGTGTKWEFQPPSAPHFGGAHESLVRSTKLALYRTLKIDSDNYRYPVEEVLRTWLFEVASLLNSRPLCYVSSDPQDFRSITPNDLLGRRPRNEASQHLVAEELPKDRFKGVQRLTKFFWDLWIKQYLPTLVARRKWTTKQRNFQPGDEVLIVEPNLPRGRWRTGRVTAVYPGRDGLVRVAKVGTEDGEITRPIHRLCLLQAVNSSSHVIAAEPSTVDIEIARGEDGAANSTGRR